MCHDGLTHSGFHPALNSAPLAHSPVTNFPTVVWTYPMFLPCLGAPCYPCESWAPMAHCHQAQLLLAHPLSALLIPASLFFLGKASTSFSPPSSPNSFLEPVFIPHLTAASPLPSPQLFCCRQASKKPGELLQFLPYILPHSICQTILLRSCKAVSLLLFWRREGNSSSAVPCLL